MSIERKVFNSTIVKSASYDSNKKELVITYKFGEQRATSYRYYDVPQEAWEGMKKAEDDPTQSVGKYVNSKIKPIYTKYVKID